MFSFITTRQNLVVLSCQKVSKHSVANLVIVLGSNFVTLELYFGNFQSLNYD